MFFHLHSVAQFRLSAEFGEVAKFGNDAKYSEVNLIKYGVVAKSDNVFLSK